VAKQTEIDAQDIDDTEAILEGRLVYIKFPVVFATSA
jgi:hypothetical protein